MISTPLQQQRNKGEKFIIAKISMNVVFDFGFFFFTMRYWCEKAFRNGGRLGPTHWKPAENLLFQGIEFKTFLDSSKSRIEFNTPFLLNRIIELQMIEIGLLWTFFDCFGLILTDYNYFETLSGQLGIFSDIIFNRFEWFWITSRHISDWPRLLLTIPVGMTALHHLFSPILTFFGVKWPFFHGWHPLFLHWLDSLLDLPTTL